MAELLALFESNAKLCFQSDPRVGFLVLWLFPFVLLSLETSCEAASLPLSVRRGERLRAHQEVWQEGEAMDDGKARPEACSSYRAFTELPLPGRPRAGCSLVAHPAWMCTCQGFTCDSLHL